MPLITEVEYKLKCTYSFCPVDNLIRLQQSFKITHILFLQSRKSAGKKAVRYLNLQEKSIWHFASPLRISGTIFSGVLYLSGLFPICYHYLARSRRKEDTLKGLAGTLYRRKEKKKNPQMLWDCNRLIGAAWRCLLSWDAALYPQTRWLQQSFSELLGAWVGSCGPRFRRLKVAEESGWDHKEESCCFNSSSCKAVPRPLRLFLSPRLPPFPAHPHLLSQTSPNKAAFPPSPALPTLSIAKLGLCLPAPRLEAHKPSSAPAAVPHCSAVLQAGICTAGLPLRISLPPPSYSSLLRAAACSLHKPRARTHAVNSSSPLWKLLWHDREDEMLLDVPPAPGLSSRHVLKQQIQLQQIPCYTVESPELRTPS